MNLLYKRVDVTSFWKLQLPRKNQLGLPALAAVLERGVVVLVGLVDLRDKLFAYPLGHVDRAPPRS